MNKPDMQLLKRPALSYQDLKPLELNNIRASHALPATLFNHPIGKAVMAIATHAQASQEMALNAVLSAYSLVIGGHCSAIHPATKMVVPLSLFALTLADSGDRKSTVDGFATKPIAEYAKLQYADYEMALQQHQNALDAFTSERSTITGNKKLSQQERQQALDALGLPPSRPRSPKRIIKGVGSAQGLRKDLTDNQAALGLFLPEGAKLLGGHAMGKDNSAAMQALLCDLWTDGNDEHSLKDGGSRLDNVLLSMHLLVQPHAWQQLAGNQLLNLTESGLIPRCLIAAPASIAGTRLIDNISELNRPAIDGNPDYKAYCLSLEYWLSMPLQYNEQSTGLKIDRAIACQHDIVKNAYLGVYNFYEGSIKDGGENIRAWCSRAGEHWLRLAAILTLANNPHAVHIEPDAAKLAIELVAYYSTEQLRLQDLSGADSETMQAAKMYNKVLAGCKRWGRGYFAAYCATNKARAAKSTKEFKRLCAILLNAGAIHPMGETVVIDDKPKREVWRFNPDFNGEL